MQKYLKRVLAIVLVFDSWYVELDENLANQIKGYLAKTTTPKNIFDI